MFRVSTGFRGINGWICFMRYGVFALLVLVTVLTGCVSLSVPGAFSPVRGPLSKQSPATPAYTAKMSGLFSGTISVDLANGEVCAGTWSFVSKTAPANTDPSAGTAAPADMAADWDFVYGAGFYVAHVVGNQLYARATLTGNIGTVMYVELSNETNTRGNTKGVAQDNKGNLFKVSVYN
jgi:hypothetical protein